MTQKNLQHVQVKRDDGSIALFPVSQSVLSLRSPAENCQGVTLTILPENAEQERSLFSSFVSPIFSWRRSALYGSVSMLLVAITFGGSPIVLGSTLSFFRDDEVSRGNLFAAASLGFDLNPGEVTVDIAAGESISISPKFTPDTGALPITYRISAEVVGEHTPLCSQLMASGTTSPIIYNGQLVSLATEPATEAGHANFEVTLATTDGIAPDSQCTVDIVYRGWHSESPENTGYTDEEADRFTFVYRAPEAEAALEELDAEPEEPAEDPEPIEAPVPEAPPTEEQVETPAEETPTEHVAEEPLQEEPVVENFSPSGGAPTGTPEENSPPSEETPSETVTPPLEEVVPPPEAPAEELTPEPTPPADVPPPEPSPATDTPA